MFLKMLMQEQGIVSDMMPPLIILCIGAILKTQALTAFITIYIFGTGFCRQMKLLICIKTPIAFFNLMTGKVGM